MAKKKRPPRGYRSPGSRGPRGPKGGGADMLAQVQQLQQQMEAAQAALAEETVEADVGGGVVRVVATGQQKIQAIYIEPEVIDPDDAEMLQDLIVAAVNKALDEAAALANERLGGLTAGLGLPPGLF
ncbi:MAG: YbaB/EbfC family nucleoid-associated protein [Chloroflexi bacterium]|nr:YbaB/EbfC family nucleoid-associated protein [Chloroflexota bacterium]